MKRSSHTHQHRTTLRRTLRRGAPVAAAVLLGAMLPLGAIAHADDGTDGGDADANPLAGAPFSGYSNEGYATPVRFEIYEPTIPIPADPQAEVNFAYTSVKADSGNSRGRASYTWPGDAVGEGTKTILENLGVPLPEAVTAGGYPIQVNSTHPGGPDSDSDEPAPGVVQRTGAGVRTTYAQTGYAGDSELENGDAAEPSDDGTPPTSGDPVGAVTDLLGGGAGGVIGQLTGGVIGTPAAPASGTPASGAPSSGSAPLIPAVLSPLVDFGNLASVTRSTVSVEKARLHSRSKVSDINLLSGVIQIGSVATDVTTFGNGTDAKTESKSTYGDMSIAGQKFTIGPDGIEAAGQPTAIPGLSDDPAAALKQLGVSITVPKPETTTDGLHVETFRSGLRIEIDTKILRSKLDAVPLGTLADMLPDEAGQLKSVLQAAAVATPRVVVLLGNAQASTETVQPLDLGLGATEPTAAPSESAAPPAAAPAAPTAGNGSGTGTSPVAAPPGDLGVPTGGDAPVSGAVTQNVADSPGLPPLASIPGALLFGGLAAGGLLGAYMRRLGIAALGGGGSLPPTDSTADFPTCERPDP